MQRGVIALHHQAHRLLRTYEEDLTRRALGLSAEDKAAIEQSKAAHPLPEGFDPNAGPTAEQQAEIEATREAALKAVYPRDGIPDEDPRLEPINGVSLPAYAKAAAAIGWSTDAALKERVCNALGLDPAAFDDAGLEWRRRIQSDMVLATLYGQLFAAASGAPEQPF